MLYNCEKKHIAKQSTPNRGEIRDAKKKFMALQCQFLNKQIEKEINTSMLHQEDTMSLTNITRTAAPFIAAKFSLYSQDSIQP